MTASAKIKLTKRVVDALIPPVRGEEPIVRWDAELTGYGVRISSTGRRSYIIQKRTKAGREIKRVLGVHGNITPDQARDLAQQELGRIAGGDDPAEDRRRVREAEEKRRRTLTIAQLCDKYLTEYALVHNRPRTVETYRHVIDRHIKPRLGAIRVPDLEQDDVAALHRDMKPTPYLANLMVAVLRRILGVAVRNWKMRPDNPAAGMTRYAEEKRQRYLSVPELGRLGAALAAHPRRIAANALRMLLLTGARSGELLAMTWEEVEREPGVWIKPSAHTKQKSEHRVPLSPGALLLLEDMRRYRKPGETLVFPGRVPGQPLRDIHKTWAACCAAAGIEGVRVHDLRHSYASLLVSSGLSLPIIGALLGHTQVATTARYAHLFDDPLREATNRVDALLTALAEDRNAEVTPLRKR
jgi:integrase